MLAGRKKRFSEKMVHVLKDLTDVFLNGGACKTCWGELELPDNLKQYYEEKNTLEHSK